ncbi:RNA pyrophosphohydrolase [Rhodobacteraceae bacterium THAF1]|uniref:NUDIX domain-containing protein n=1 Tax=Palleronia sp. THAF1 TaxID=2587842 RepID=UPI000F3E270C|nr:NUDIX hydrolase [Palleronia sp. THAF1]QFU10187.1 RNA pyrophosphohydrolase [Palleronia sp. THAF1]VDC16908.1 RNA pyrophosphohydrolase [Rhodobacteraceae bacterium THAF1]
MIRRYGPPPLRDRTYPARPGAYAVLWQGGDVLLTWQGGIHDEFQLPGGGIEAGEHPIPALHREVLEETGWHMASPRKLGTFRRFTFMPDYDRYAEKVCHVYLARPTLRIGLPSEPDHVPVWMPIRDAVSKLANRGDAAMVLRALGA